MNKDRSNRAAERSPAASAIELLAEIKRRLAETHGQRLRGVILYGSEARGDARPDSDVDVLVLLDDPVELGRDLQRNLDALYPLALQIGRRISALPASVRDYEEYDCPLFRAVHREGVLA